MRSVILAGGLGTRLQPYTMFLPKPMLPLGEKPLLEHLIEWNRRNGVKSIVLCVSYLRKAIMDYFESGSRFGVEIEYAVSDRPLATAGQLRTAAPLVGGGRGGGGGPPFVCMYGDSIYGFGLRSMISQHRRDGPFVTMGLYEYTTNLPYGVIETGRGGIVTKWNEKPEIRARINMGCYVLDPDAFGYIPEGRPYGMDDLVRTAIADGRQVGSYVTKKGFMDIGDKASYKKAYQHFVEKLGKV